MPAKLKPIGDDRAALGGGHFVQLHGSNVRALTRGVSHFIAEGLASGSAAVAVVPPGDREAFLAALTEVCDAARAMGDGSLTFLDAHDVLDRFMIRGYPDRERFDASVGEIVRQACARSVETGVRVYGGMVGAVWQAGQYPAAIRLEQLWNGLRRRIPLTVYCGYPIDVFGSSFEAVTVDVLLRAHTEVIPSEASGRLERSLSRAIDDVLRVYAQPFEPQAHAAGSGAVLPPGESMILWLKKHHPDRADEVLAQARNYYNERLA